MSDEPNNLPATQQPRAVLQHTQPPLDAVVAGIRNRCLSGAEWNFGSLLMLHPPSEADRAELSRRHKSIVNNLTHFDEHQISAVIAETIACYRNFVKPEDSTKNESGAVKVLRKYVNEMRGLPTWAIVKACYAIRTGTAPGISMQFPFSTIELRVLAESYITRFQDEATEISRILLGKALPEPVSDEERAKVKRKLNRLAHKMKMKLASDRELRAKPGNELMRQASDRFLQRELAERNIPASAVACAPSPYLVEIIKRKGGEYGSDRATIERDGSPAQRMESRKG